MLLLKNIVYIALYIASATAFGFAVWMLLLFTLHLHGWEEAARGLAALILAAMAQKTAEWLPTPRAPRGW